jgi:AcrR family transcriptional regulator
VRVQLVARDVGISDAAVHYHFGNRAGLLEALLSRAGRRLREELTSTVSHWDPGSLDVAALVSQLRETYETRQYARLTMWISVAGWRSRGSGMLRGLAEAVHEARITRARARGRTEPALDDTLLTVELLNLVVWADAIIGHSFRRMVGMPADRSAASRFMDWFVRLISDHLEHDVP